MRFELYDHGRRYAPEYPPHGHSDHLPMAWLALQGLGADAARREAFAAAYLPRLVPLPPDHTLRERQRALLAELRRDGAPAVLKRRLPDLISGWYRAAYHPLIRLGYGLEFGVLEEVAAGLAYMEAAGASAELEKLAADSRFLPGVAGTGAWRRAAAWSLKLPDADSFSARAEAALAHPRMAELAVTVDDNLRTMSLAALAAFADTHDFFALHLVTGSHAFRLVHPWAGRHADAVLNLGLLAGYVAIGAPAFPEMADHGPGELETVESTESRLRSAGPPPERLLALCADDEHHLKLAYTAWAQACHWGCNAYLTVAETYLSRQGTRRSIP